MPQTNLLEALWEKIGRAIGSFSLITDGDSIAIGLSGGKDSLVLAFALARFAKVAPVRFGLTAITIDTGYAETGSIRIFCEGLGITHYSRAVEVPMIAAQHGLENNPCSICARLRRGALHSFAATLGCNKVALGHHADDAIETLIMNLFMNGRIDCFKPSTLLTRAKLTLIRPLVYTPESLIAAVAEELSLPIVENRCPVAKRTKRQEAKTFLTAMETANPGAKARALAALSGKGGPWHGPMRTGQ